MKKKCAGLSVVFILISISAPVLGDSYSFNADMSFHSIYHFRGLNLYRTFASDPVTSTLTDSQMDQKMAVQTMVTFFHDSGTWLCLFSSVAVQDRDQLVKQGVSDETDIFLGWSGNVVENLIDIDAQLGVYSFPFMDDYKASDCTIIEPLVTALFIKHARITPTLTLSWFHGLGDIFTPISYYYIQPGISYSNAISDQISLDPALEFGYKIPEDDDKYWVDWTQQNGDKLNIMHILFSVPLTYTLSNGLYIKTYGAFMWTDVMVGKDNSGIAAWGGIHLGYDAEF